MSKKQFAQSAPEVQHAQQAIAFVLRALPYLAMQPDKPADVQLYDKYSLQIQHKLTVLKRSVLNSSGEMRYNLLALPNYVDALAQCLLLPSRAAALALEILRLHCLDSQLLDHSLLMHENLLRGVRFAFYQTAVAQEAAVFLLKDLCVSPYNQKALLYDENAIFVLQNALFIADNEVSYLVRKAALEAIEILAKNDVLVGYFVFEEVLIDFLSNSELKEEIETAVGILKTFYADENFEQDNERIAKIVSIISEYDSAACEDFLRFAEAYADADAEFSTSGDGAEDFEQAAQRSAEEAPEQQQYL